MYGIGGYLIAASTARSPLTSTRPLSQAWLLPHLWLVSFQSLAIARPLGHGTDWLLVDLPTPFPVISELL